MCQFVVHQTDTPFTLIAVRRTEVTRGQAEIGARQLITLGAVATVSVTAAQAEIADQALTRFIQTRIFTKLGGRACCR